MSFVKRHYNDIFKEECKNPYETRNRGKNITVPKTRLKLIDKRPYCKRVVLFNKLPDNIKIFSNVNIFRIEVKRFLLQYCFYSVQEYLECKYT